MCRRGNDAVKDGWTGAGVGDNWCNRCVCQSGLLQCTKRACGKVASIQPYSVRYHLGTAPYLEPNPDSVRNPNNIQQSLRDCELQCLSLPDCRYGTYITDGARRGECWLAANTTKALEPCNVACQSFVKLLRQRTLTAVEENPFTNQTK